MVKKLLIFLLLIGSASAINETQYGFFDINTLQLLAGVNVSVSNETSLVSEGISAVNGYVLLESGANTSFTAKKSGYIDHYQPFGVYQTVTNTYLTPYSLTGLIMGNFQDLTIAGNRDFCVYYQDNGRLHGCYTTGNASVKFLTNRNYTIIPQITKSDAVSSPGNLRSIGYLYAPFILSGLALIIAMLALAYYVIFRRGKL